MLNTTGSHDREPLFFDAVLISWALLEDEGVLPSCWKTTLSTALPCAEPVADRIRGRL